MEGWTDSEWEALIHEKASEIELDLGPGPLASIMSPSDDRFPLALDHTLLKPDATSSQIDAFCAEAIKFGFKVFIFYPSIRTHLY
jgi:deoxyribose-phosphate aldolase